MSHARIFFAHPKDCEAEAIDAALAHIMNDTALPDSNATITSARDSFLDFEAKYGKPVNWKRWFEHVLGNITSFGANPRFDAFVVGPESTVGKATKDTIVEALRRNRAIYRMTPDGKVIKATKVVCLDAENYKHGWVVA
jgi:vancomycin resistance protein YoaR